MANIFDTTANTDFNAFSDPFNPANMNPGQWGINPNYLTPSYSAAYRPGYGGGNGYSANPGQPGFGSSVNNFLNPLAPSLMYGNPYRNNSPFAEQMHSRPVDAAMWANQRIVVPATSLYLSYKMGNIMTRRNNVLGGNIAAHASELFGGSSAEVAAARSTQGIFGAMGDRFAQGGVNGMFGAARSFTRTGIFGDGLGAAAFRTGIAEGAGIVGGVAGSLLIPGAIGLAGAAAFSKLAVDPYIAFSRTGSDLRRNFANTQVAGASGGGNALSGRGMSFGSSYSIAKDINKAGIHDMTFDSSEFSQISDFSARAGLLDDATIGQISKRVKNIANQVKMVMRIANEPDIKSAIEMLSNLNSAGASVSSGDAGRALSRIGANAAISGISTQRMINTVGMQGQYLFGANGMVPFMGGIAASNNMATFASAKRQGVLSQGLMAMMGQEEGATQSSLTAQINGSQSIYNKIVMANRYMGGFTGGGVVNNLNNFGSSFAKNPVGAYGEMMMNSGLMASKQFGERGELGLQDQIMDIARNIPGMVKKGGRIDAANAYSLMTGAMGLSHTDAFAYIQQITAGQNPKVQAQMLSANNAHTIEQMTQNATQEGYGYGNYTPLVRAARRGGQIAMDAASTVPIMLKEAAGRAMDWGLDKFYKFQYGDEIGGGGGFGGISSLSDARNSRSSIDQTSPNQGYFPDFISDERRNYNSKSYYDKLEQGLSSISARGPLEAARRIQAATEVMRKGGKLDPNDPDSAQILDALGMPGSTGFMSDVVAQDIVSKAGKAHILGYGAIPGLKSSESIMSDVAKDPSRYLSGGFLQSYKSAKTDNERQMAVIMSTRKDSGATLFDKISGGVSSSGDAKALVDQLRIEQTGTSRNRSIIQLAKEGKIDASQFTIGLAANNMLEASENLLRFAGQVTGNPAGATPDSTNPVSGIGSYFPDSAAVDRKTQFQNFFQKNKGN